MQKRHINQIKVTFVLILRKRIARKKKEEGRKIKFPFYTFVQINNERTQENNWKNRNRFASFFFQLKF